MMSKRYLTGSLDASTKRVGIAEELRASMIVGRYIGRSELTQVNGSVFIFDFTGLTAKHMARWSVDDMSRWSKLWQVGNHIAVDTIHRHVRVCMCLCACCVRVCLLCVCVCLLCVCVRVCVLNFTE